MHDLFFIRSAPGTASNALYGSGSMEEDQVRAEYVELLPRLDELRASLDSSRVSVHGLNQESRAGNLYAARYAQS